MTYEYKVLGVNRIDTVTDKGERINGVQLWVCAPTASPGWQGGVEVFKLWKPFGDPLFDTVMGLRHGMKITGNCDRKGRPISIEIIG